MWSIKANFIFWGLNILNALVLFSGFLLTLVGLLFKTALKYDHIFVSDQIERLTLTLLVIGVVFIALGVAGVVSLNTTVGSPMVVASYMIGLMVVTCWLAIFSGTTWMAFSENAISDQAKTQMNSTFHIYVEKVSQLSETQQIDHLQTKFSCCGLLSYKDWKLKNNDPNFHSSISKYKLLISPDQIPFDLPDTCCQNFSHNCGKDFRQLETINTNGCFEPFLGYLEFRILVICCISLGITGIHVLSLFFWLIVSIALKADYSVVNPSMKEKNYQAVSTTNSGVVGDKVIDEGGDVVEFIDTDSI